MVDLLGPGDAGASRTLTTTTDVQTPVAGDTYYQDCVGGVSGTGTPAVSKWLNRFMQQMRTALRKANVPLDNSQDNMLSWAMQSGFVNWVGDFGGTANAITGAAPNAPQAIEGGTHVCGIVGTTTNTGAVTFNWATLGAQPVLTAEGFACTGGEIVNGAFLVLRWDGGAWRIVSPNIYQGPYNCTITGTDGVYSGSSANAPKVLKPGTIVTAYIAGTAPTNSGGSTFNWSGFGAANVGRCDAKLCQGGEFVSSGHIALFWDGSIWIIISSLPPPVIPPPFAYGDVGSYIFASNPSTGAPNSFGLPGTWAMISGAATVPYAYGPGGVYQGSLYQFKRVA